MQDSVDQGSVLDSLGEARRYADPDSPRDGRLLASGGALPLQPHEISGVLFALTLDPDAEVKDRARRSLDTLPDAIVDATLEAQVHPALLADFAGRFREVEARILKIALNPATSNETLYLAATLPFQRVVDIVANNQQRLTRCPALIEALGENPLTGQAAIDRILQFLRVEAGVAQEGQAEDAPDTLEAAEELAPEPEGLPTEDDFPPELIQEQEPAENEEEEELRSKSLYSLIQDMNVLEKIKLGIFGNGEARSLLVRDSNRIVAMAAIRSPKVTDHEVASISKSRSVHEDVLRYVANNRNWTRAYSVQRGLVTNPRAPQQAAIKFLNYLTDRDLRQIMRSREVPSAISVQARRILVRKGKI